MAFCHRGSDNLALGIHADVQFLPAFLLLLAGIIVMVVFYTGWGLWEILKLGPAPLP